MKVIKPNVIDDPALVSSSEPETEHAAWSSGTTYALGDLRIKAHRVWQSMQAANLNHDPETAGVAWWVDVGPTNRWAMFDGVVSTATTATGTLTVEIAPGRADAVALMGLSNVTSATVSMTVGATEVYSRTESLIVSDTIADWYAYFFAAITLKSELVLTDLPIYGEGVITITLLGSGEIGCGVCAAGLQTELGGTLAGPTAGIVDYSTVTRDAFGAATFTKRGYSRRCSVRLVLDGAEVDRIYSVLATFRATPMIWVGADNLYLALVIYGFYKDFEIDIAYANMSYCTLSIEGLT